MKIVPIKIDTKTLYENRHLLTDDIHYNSLVISNLINKKVELFDIKKVVEINEHQQNELMKTLDYNMDLYVLEKQVLLAINIMIIFNNIETKIKDVIRIDRIDELNNLDDSINNINILVIEGNYEDRTNRSLFRKNL